MAVGRQRELLKVLFDLKELFRASLKAGVPFPCGVRLVVSRAVVKKALRGLGYSGVKADRLIDELIGNDMIRVDRDGFLEIPLPELVDDVREAVRASEQTSSP